MAGARFASPVLAGYKLSVPRVRFPNLRCCDGRAAAGGGRRVLISRSQGFIFVHIPRTGGNSVRRALSKATLATTTSKSGVQKVQRLMTNRIGPGAKSALAVALQTTPLRYYITTAGHPSAALLKLTVPEFNSYKSFSFVRNPYERIISAYKGARMQGVFDGTFEAFVADCRRYAQPQVNFLTFRGRLLVDFVGKFERIQQDFDYVCDWIGLEHRPLPKLSATDLIDARECLTPKNRQKIAEIYAEDFKAFRYPE